MKSKNFLKSFLLLTILSLCLNNNSYASEIIINEKDKNPLENIYLLGDLKEKKISWEKPFISYEYITDDKEFIKAKGFNSQNLYEELNGGISGDLLQYGQTKVGTINTVLGTMEIVWRYQEQGNEEDTELYICTNNKVCNPFKLKDMGKNKGLIFGDFKNFIQGGKILDLKEKQEIGLAVIDVNKLFKNKPNLKVKYQTTNEKTNLILWNEEFENLNSVNSLKIEDSNDNYILKGKLNLNKESKEIYFITNGLQRVLTLSDGTRLFSKKDLSSSEKVILFYLDFDNNKKNDVLEVKEIAKVNAKDIKEIPLEKFESFLNKNNILEKKINSINKKEVAK